MLGTTWNYAMDVALTLNARTGIKYRVHGHLIGPNRWSYGVSTHKCWCQK